MSGKLHVEAQMKIRYDETKLNRESARKAFENMLNALVIEDEFELGPAGVAIEQVSWVVES